MAWPFDNPDESPIDYYDSLVQETVNAFDPNTWYGIKEAEFDFDVDPDSPAAQADEAAYPPEARDPFRQAFADQIEDGQFAEEPLLEQPDGPSIDLTDPGAFEDETETPEYAPDLPDVTPLPATPLPQTGRYGDGVGWAPETETIAYPWPVGPEPIVIDVPRSSWTEVMVRS